MPIPFRQIRAVYDAQSIRVYQAYSHAIADSALAHGRFVSPPFKLERMTWIKPSYLWMMYRAGWGQKDSGQQRILAIDIRREGFEWALTNSLLSHQGASQGDTADWQARKRETPVRIQWDPERDLHLAPLPHRAIQIGLSGEAVSHYVNDWITGIHDLTAEAREVHALVQEGRLEEARTRLPVEREYLVSEALRVHLGMDEAE
ncbi:MAG: hypothetical protein GAK45_00441 [Pseudomonas citronellolis]|nr:MAG: hypothetical protein GAK45_00441 [Pseudomonas citronellolis]